MKQLREHIRKEIIKLAEEKNLVKHKAPLVVMDALRKIFPGPVVRYVENLKAANTIPPSYRVFLREGGKHFDLILERISVVAKIGPKTYWLMNDDEVLLAQQELNRLLISPVLNPDGDEETDDSGDTGGGGSSSSDVAFDDDSDDSEDEEETEEPEA